jgi:starch synthase (maltosyl-transferring)
VKEHLGRGRVLIENVRPQVDCGRYRAKAVTGDEVRISADIFREGPEVIRAVVRHKGPSGARWSETRMTHEVNDLWIADITVTGVGVCRYTIEAWPDPFATWRRDFVKRVEAGQEDIDVELLEGAGLVEVSVAKVPAAKRKTLPAAIDAMRAGGEAGIAAALDETLFELIDRYQPRKDSTTLKPSLELFVDRPAARFSAWYEFFPRSTGIKAKHGTFETAGKALHRIADLGFDVVYLPPIHPIGRTHRKGLNNTLVANSGDVGVPWAIGGPEGGHTAVHPDLGTIDDFDAFMKEAEAVGVEVALDFAIQASPDHPWVKEHPEWFKHRADGSIRYAENPPKKYQDIYPINFDTEDKDGLWRALKDVVDFWISHGVKIFRVDNPHTKPFAFWEWLIAEVKNDHPEVIFLAEAFTRPKVMKALAKLGFTQSYTYFTWRNSKDELTEYMTELAHTDTADYFRPNFFVNTPDILHEYLQMGGPPAFKIRLALAALLSPAYGVYSGYELFENEPIAKGSEEYLDSEKYQVRPRDFDREPNLNGYIKRINQIRRKFSSLSHLTNLRFHDADKDRILAFSKVAPGEDAILAVVNLNPFHWEEATLSLDLDSLGILDHTQPFEVQDLITGETYVWHGPSNYVRLDPSEEPAHIFRVKR